MLELRYVEVREFVDLLVRNLRFFVACKTQVAFFFCNLQNSEPRFKYAHEMGQYATILVSIGTRNKVILIPYFDFMCYATHSPDYSFSGTIEY